MSASLKELGEVLCGAMQGNAEMLRKGADLMDDLAHHADGSVRDPELMSMAQAWIRKARHLAAEDVRAGTLAKAKFREVAELPETRT